YEPVEVVRVDAEGARGLGEAAAGLFEGAKDELLFGLAQGVVVLGDGPVRGARRRLGFEDVFGKVFGKDALGRAEHDGALDGVLKLADVARPVVTSQALARLRREARHAALEPGRVLRREVAGEERDVLAALSKRRHLEGDDVESVVQVLSDRTHASVLLNDSFCISYYSHLRTYVACASTVP